MKTAKLIQLVVAFTAWGGILTVAGAQGYNEVWAMSDSEIVQIPDENLCTAVAMARDRNLSFPTIDREVTRRRADCSVAIQNLMGDCAPLTLVSHEPVPGRGHAFHVRNESDHAIQFYINYNGVASSPFIIEPNRTQGYGVQTDILTGMLGRFINRENLNSRNVEFFNCTAQGVPLDRQGQVFDGDGGTKK